MLVLHAARSLMKRVLLFFLPILCFFPASHVAIGQDFWQQTNGPFGGFIQTLVVDPSGRLFAGTAEGGLFRSTDDGGNWTLVKGGLTSTNVASLAFGSSGKAYAGTGAGVFRSTDGGGSWTGVGGVLPEQAISLAINSSGHIFAGTWSSGVFRSTDNGESWMAIDSGLTSPPVMSIAINSSGYVFAANGEGGVFRSTNNGATWTAVNSGLVNAATYMLVISSSGQLFAGTNSGVFRSTDNGGNWTAVNYGMTYCEVRSLAINSAGHVFAGCIYGRGIFRSTDNGQTWATVSNGLTNMDAQALAISSSGIVFTGTAGGVFRSTDNGGNWIPANNGLAGFAIQTLAVGYSGNFFAGTDNGLFRSTDNGGSWTEVSSGLASRNIRSLAINSSGHVFAGTWDEGVFRSTDNGGNWTALDTGLVSAAIQALAINSSGTIFAGTEYSGIFRSMDNGKSWVQVNGGLTETRAEALAINSAGYVFAGTNGAGVFRSTDNGGSWKAVNTGLGNMWVQSLAIDSANHVFAGGYDGGSIFRSTDNGDSWIEVSKGLPSRNVSSIGVNSSGHVFVATSDWGVFRSSDIGGNWASINGGLTNTAVYSLAVSSTGYVFAGTLGSGVFRSLQSTLATPLPPNPTSPSIGAVNQPTTVALSWNPSIGAASYRLQVSTESGFAALSFDDSTITKTSQLVSSLKNSTKYYWRVNAKNMGGIGGWSSVWTFTTVVAAPSQPTLVSPANASQDQSLSLTLTWNPVSGATSYRLQFDKSNTFPAPLFLDDSLIASPSRIVSSLTNSTTYYWRVSAKNAGGSSPFSTIYSFVTVAAAPNAPTLSTPANNATGVSSSVSLTWSSIVGATNYHLQVSTNSGFSLPMVLDDSSVASSPRQLSGLAANTIYYWRVRAKNVSGFGGWSSSFTFTTLGSKTVTSPGISFPPNPSASTDYRLVGFPGTASLSVGQVLTGAQNTDWRIHKENGATEPNNLTELTSSSPLNPGEGYWLITKGMFTFSNTLTMPQLGPDGTYTINVRSGWNIIGNPFDVAVPWSVVRADNSTTASLWTYSGTAGYQSSTTLEPFKGYYFSSSSTTLKIRYPFPSSSVASSAPSVIDWKLQLALETEGNSDSENYIGQAPSAKESLDDLDQPKPPRFLDQASLSLSMSAPNGGEQFMSSDFRPSTGEGKVWNVSVTNPKRAKGRMRIIGVGNVPSGFEIVLINAQNTAPIDIRTQSEIPLVNSAERQVFHLIVGKKDFVQAKEAQLIPKEFELSQNYPNPFNPSTTITYRVPKEANVRLEILSLLGQQLETLAEGTHTPGTYSVVWSIADRREASGVYFARLLADGKVVKTQKMTLLK